MTSGMDHVLLVTAKGQSIRFAEEEVRSMGRTAKGVVGIKLKKKEDKVIGMMVVPLGSEDYDLITVAEKGYGKKTSLEEYRAQSRGGSGLITYSVTDKTGDVVAARLEPIEKKEKPRDVLLATQMGKVIRIAEKQIPQLTRNTLGVRLIKLSKDDKVSSVAFLD
jgi:DNA gyrase subunit A